ncbi:Hsp33 family molecular chaperone HslO [Nibricoccus sp. IMCC34717]|uniref:Hsp33 family molecular chaperone HslO n=1 Tax=Nibricoccus sp. IMCC34717 TaxID=3034021 RepID=UPI0038509007
MAATTPVDPAEPGLEVRTHFVRSRNVVTAAANFGDLYVDYYLHLGQNRVKVAEAHDALFKRALAAYTLHCAHRPWREMSAWTMHFEEPLVNLFLTCDNETGAITGRIFADSVKAMGRNLLYADLVRPGQPNRRSTIDFTGTDPLLAVEALYAQSEQRPGRLFQLSEEEFAIVVEHPDCDTAWFEALNPDRVRALPAGETLSLLERRIYRWHCGCNEQRIREVLGPAMNQNPEELFGDQASIEIRCPRCAAAYVFTK